MAKKEIAVLGEAELVKLGLIRFIIKEDRGVIQIDLFLLVRQYLDPLRKNYPSPSVYRDGMKSTGDPADAVGNAGESIDPGAPVGGPARGVGENKTWLRSKAWPRSVATNSSGRYPRLLPNKEAADRVFPRRGRNAAVPHAVKRMSPVRFLFRFVRGRSVYAYCRGGKNGAKHR